MAVVAKVNYAKVANASDKGWMDYILWEMITPGYTAIFLLLTGAWYLYKAMNTDNTDLKAAYYETTIAFGLWGVFNAGCYAYLAYRHNKPPI